MQFFLEFTTSEHEITSSRQRFGMDLTVVFMVNTTLRAQQNAALCPKVLLQNK